MADTTGPIPIEQIGDFLSLAQVVCNTSTSINEGAMVSPLTASGLAVKSGTASVNPCCGVAKATISTAYAGQSLDVLQGLFVRANSGSNPLRQVDLFKPAYCEDDQTLSRDSGDGELAGIFCGFTSDSRPIVFIHAGVNYLLSQGALAATLASIANGAGASTVAIEDAATNFDAANVEAALAEIMTIFAGTAASTGANKVGYDDSGNKTTAATVADALDAIFVDLTSAYVTIDIPFDASWYGVGGTALAAFADGASNTPGLALDNAKAAGIRWNNAAAPDPICKAIAVPWDLDESADVIAKVVASKSGNTLADATTFDLGVFNGVTGAASDADANYGSTTGAMTGDAAAKTIQSVSATLALANLPNPDAADCFVTVTVQPTDGTLGTDDVTAHFLRLRYKRKLRTS